MLDIMRRACATSTIEPPRWPFREESGMWPLDIIVISAFVLGSV